MCTRLGFMSGADKQDKHDRYWERLTKRTHGICSRDFTETKTYWISSHPHSYQIRRKENEKELVDQQKNLSVGNETHNCFTIASKTIGGLKNVFEKYKN